MKAEILCFLRFEQKKNSSACTAELKTNPNLDLKCFFFMINMYFVVGNCFHGFCCKKTWKSLFLKNCQFAEFWITKNHNF